MASEHSHRRLPAAQEAASELARVAEASGALRHLHNQPLDLSDDSPDWFLNRLLKREGLAPPALERGKEVDRAVRQAHDIVARLQRRRDWLSSPEARCTSEQASDFNRARVRALDEYRGALIALNRMILDYNLMAPSALHRRGFRVDEAVAEAASAIDPLDPAPGPGESGAATTRWSRFGAWLRRSPRR